MSYPDQGGGYPEQGGYPQQGGGYQQGGYPQQQGGNYPQGGYPQQGGNYPYPQTQPGNGLAIAGMVCGIVGLLIANIILGPLAIIFGGIGLARANKGAKHKGQAIAGIVLGVLDIAIIIIIVAVASNGNYFSYYGN